MRSLFVCSSILCGHCHGSISAPHSPTRMTSASIRACRSLLRVSSSLLQVRDRTDAHAVPRVLVDRHLLNFRFDALHRDQRADAIGVGVIAERAGLQDVRARLFDRSGARSGRCASLLFRNHDFELRQHFVEIELRLGLLATRALVHQRAALRPCVIGADCCATRASGRRSYRYTIKAAVSPSARPATKPASPERPDRRRRGVWCVCNRGAWSESEWRTAAASDGGRRTADGDRGQNRSQKFCISHLALSRPFRRSLAHFTVRRPPSAVHSSPFSPAPTRRGASDRSRAPGA